jgi:hypothetical protein
MKNGFDKKYVCQVGSTLQDALVCKLAIEAGYTTLRDVLADFYGKTPTQVYKANLKTVSVVDAARIIQLLKAKQLPVPPTPKPKIKRASDNSI